MRRRTYQAKPDEVPRDWFVVDVAGQTLGRVATQIAVVLRGKHKPQFTEHVDAGDFVVVLNADRVVLTGDKLNKKLYHRHSGYPGGLRTFTAGEMLQRKPEELVRRAVKGMLPKNSLGRRLLKKLKVYTGESHPHSAQQPKVMTLKANGTVG